MSSGTVLLLLGVGLGAVALAGRAVGREPSSSLRQRADDLHAQTARAQVMSARASSRARALLDQWSAAEDAARKAGV